ncbi:MFS transporter [Streptomyces sp. NBC_01477]|uniref:MFS transporter n=1 Tax=Streptomyces sp. NBC_01477 TaxID=2976015 RepID=UPI002E32ED54|nr:MFS transporter [Streptomyces sp. NBC_01477]
MSATDVPGADAPAPAPAPPVAAALALFGAAFLAMLDLSISVVALPAIREDLHASLSGLQWTVDGYTLCFASLLLAGGLLSDRLGHRTGLLASLALFVAGSVASMLAGDVGVLIAGRAMQGTAAAILVPASMALIANLYPDVKQRAKMLGIWSALSGIAIALGPALGGVLVGQIDWRAIFALNIVLGVAAGTLALAAIPKAPAHAAARLDAAGLLLGIVWTFSLAFAVIEASPRGWSSPWVVGAFVVAAAGLGSFLLVESRRENAMLPIGLFRSGGFTTAGLVAFALGFSLSTAFYLLSLHLQQVLGYSPVKAGLGFLPAALAMIATAGLGGKLAEKYGPRPVTLAGVLVGAAGLFSMASVGPGTGFWTIAWMLVLIGAGLGISLPPNNNVALGSVGPERAGIASGTVETLMQFGTVVGIAVLGLVQATSFRSSLRHALGRHALSPEAAGRITDAVTSGHTPDTPGMSHDTLSRLVAASFSHGLDLAWAVSGALAVATVLAALLIRPARTQPKTGTTTPATADSVGAETG